MTKWISQCTRYFAVTDGDIVLRLLFFSPNIISITISCNVILTFGAKTLTYRQSSLNLNQCGWVRARMPPQTCGQASGSLSAINTSSQGCTGSGGWNEKNRGSFGVNFEMYCSLWECVRIFKLKILQIEKYLSENKTNAESLFKIMHRHLM